MPKPIIKNIPKWIIYKWQGHIIWNLHYGKNLYLMIDYNKKDNSLKIKNGIFKNGKLIKKIKLNA